MVGNVMFDDPATPLSFHSTKMVMLTFNGNQAHIAGRGKANGANVSFTVDVTDNGYPGPLVFDFFSIHLSNGYSASGNLTSGDITIH